MASFPSAARRALLIGSYTFVALAGLLLVTWGYSFVHPIVSNAVKQNPDGTREAFDMPLMDLSQNAGHMAISFDLFVPSRWSPLSFRRYFSTSTPIDTLTVNGVGIAYDEDLLTLDLSSVLHPGRNGISATLHAKRELPTFVFGLEPARNTLMPWAYFFACAAIVLLWLRFVLRVVFDVSLPRSIVFLLILATLVRSGYAFAVPYYIYAHDVSGHTAYLQHVAAHWTVPLTFSSWQAHQAPLYYFLLAPFYAFAERMGLGLSLSLAFVQQTSVLLSIGMVIAGVSVVRSMYPKDCIRSLLGIGLICFFPGLLCFASLINNDVLLAFIGFVWFSFLLRAFRSHSLRDWALVGLCGGIGLLTKGNAILMLPIVALCAIASMRTWKHRFGAMLLSTAVAVAIVSPLIVWRSVADPNYGLVANAHYLRTSVLLDPVPAQLITFNPMRVLRQRVLPEFTKSFPEALFFTSQFGYVDFGEDGIVILVFAMMLLPIAFLGAIGLIKRGEPVPVLAVVALIAGLLLFRLQSPYPSSQHYRYIAIIVLPLSVLIAEGTRFFPARLYRAFAEMLVALYILSSALLFVGIIMEM